MNILITNASRKVALIEHIKNACKRLNYRGKVIASDNDLLSSALYFADYYIKTPLVSESDYIDEILNICHKNNISIIIPTIDLELPLFASLKKVWKSKYNIEILISDKETISTCNDKLKTFEFFKSLKVPFPRIYTLNENPQSFPYYIKPRTGSGTRDHFIAYNHSMLQGISKAINISNYIINEFIKGKEYTIDIICNRDNQLIGHCIRERIEVRGGVMDKGRTVHNNVIYKYIKTIADKLKIFGPANIQCIERDNEYYFIEINPRFSGGFPLSVYAGLDIPHIVLKLLLLKNIHKEELNYKEDIFLISYSANLKVLS